MAMVARGGIYGNFYGDGRSVHEFHIESDYQWRRVNDESFEYAIYQGRHGDEFVKLADGSCLRRPIPATSETE